jgi:hypothetical protein
MSLTGVSFITQTTSDIPHLVEMTMLDTNPITCQCRLIHHEKSSGHASRVRLEFVDLTGENHRKLVLNLFASPETWQGVHEQRVRSKVLMVFHFFRGVVRCLLPLRNQTRRGLRKKTMRLLPVRIEDQTFKVLLRDFSRQGLGLFYFGKEAPSGTTWMILEGNDKTVQRSPVYRQVYRKRMMPYVWRVGIQVQTKAMQTSHRESKDENQFKHAKHGADFPSTLRKMGNQDSEHE